MEWQAYKEHVTHNKTQFQYKNVKITTRSSTITLQNQDPNGFTTKQDDVEHLIKQAESHIVITLLLWLFLFYQKQLHGIKTNNPINIINTNKNAHLRYGVIITDLILEVAQQQKCIIDAIGKL